MTRFILKFILIVKTPEATFKGVRIKSEGGIGRPLGKDGPTITSLNLDSYLPRFVIGNLVNPRVPKFIQIKIIFVF